MSDPSPIVNALIAATSDNNEDVSHAALEALGNYQTPTASDFLAATLQSKNLKMRDIAKSILTRQRHPSVIPTLLFDLKSPRGYVRLAAVKLLAEFTDQSAVPELVKCLKDEHPDVRRRAATALGKIAESSTFEYLFSAMIAEDNKEASAALATAIGQVGTMEHVQVILEAIVSRQTDGTYQGTLKNGLENAATELLTNLGDVDGMLAALQHDNNAIRVIAARVLGQLEHLD